MTVQVIKTSAKASECVSKRIFIYHCGILDHWNSQKSFTNIFHVNLMRGLRKYEKRKSRWLFEIIHIRSQLLYARHFKGRKEKSRNGLQKVNGKNPGLKWLENNVNFFECPIWNSNLGKNLVGDKPGVKSLMSFNPLKCPSTLLTKIMCIKRYVYNGPLAKKTNN